MPAAKKTRKAGAAAKRTKVPGTIMVDSLKSIPTLEKALKSGKLNIILVFAEWCGACHRFRKNIWDPMCKKNAVHNRIAVRDDMVQNTSLANAKFDYLPSILVVDEKGVMQTFQQRDGSMGNAMKTPQNIEEMEKIVNIPLTPVATAAAATAPPQTIEAAIASAEAQEAQEAPLINTTPLTPAKPTPLGTPNGITYTPTPTAVPRGGGRGGGKGNLFNFLQNGSLRLSSLRKAFFSTRKASKKRSSRKN